jgi:hypothetical protein
LLAIENSNPRIGNACIPFNIGYSPVRCSTLKFHHKDHLQFRPGLHNKARNGAQKRDRIVIFTVINDEGFMNIAVKKIELIEWLSKVQDEKLIKKVEGLRREADADWWDTLTAEQKEDIEAGLADLEAGRKKDFKKALSKYRG